MIKYKYSSWRDKIKQIEWYVNAGFFKQNSSLPSQQMISKIILALIPIVESLIYYHYYNIIIGD